MLSTDTVTNPGASGEGPRLAFRLRRFAYYLAHGLGIWDQAIYISRDRFVLLGWFQFSFLSRSSRRMVIFREWPRSTPDGRPDPKDFSREWPRFLDMVRGRYGYLAYNPFRVNLDSAGVFFRRVTLPGVSRSRLNAALHWEIKKILPSARARLVGSHRQQGRSRDGQWDIFYAGAKAGAWEEIATPMLEGSPALRPGSLVPGALAWLNLTRRRELAAWLFAGRETIALVIAGPEKIYSCQNFLTRDVKRLSGEVSAQVATFERETNLPLRDLWLLGEGLSLFDPFDLEEQTGLNCSVIAPGELASPLVRDPASDRWGPFSLTESGLDDLNLQPEEEKRRVQQASWLRRGMAALAIFLVFSPFVYWQLSSLENIIRAEKGYALLSARARELDGQLERVEAARRLNDGLFQLEKKRSNRAWLLLEVARAAAAGKAVLTRVKITNLQVQLQGYLPQGKYLGYMIDYFHENELFRPPGWVLRNNIRNQGKYKFFTLHYKRKKRGRPEGS